MDSFGKIGGVFGLLAFWCAAASSEEPLGISARPGETIVRVWAPHARSVEIVGEFNGWKASASERLWPDAATGIWTATLKRSRPSGPYRFLINGNLPRRDPYGRAVTPDGRSSLFYDPAAFAWEDDRPAVLAPDDLVIYEMHVGAYHDPKPQDGLPGTFYDAIKRLDHLAELGVSVVLLMPVHEFNGMHSWGYNPCDIFAAEQAYGGPDGLKAFVKAAHRLGMAVHLDVVHNHYGPENLDLFQFDGSGGGQEGGIYFYGQPGLAQTPWGPRVRFDDPTVRRFVRDNIFMWLEEYRVDGFRWDSPSNIRAYDNGSVPIPAGAQMLDDINSQIRARFPHTYSIAEDSMDIGTFHASWDFDFHHRVVPTLSATNDAERDVGALAAALEFLPVTMDRVVYVDNHDEAGRINQQSRMATDVAPLNPSGDYARRMCGLGAVMTLTAPGIPLLLMGNEFQESGAFHDDQPLDWGKKQRHAGLFNLHRELIRLRRNLDGRGDALKGREVRTPLLDRGRNVLVYWRWHARDPGRPFVVAMNVSGKGLDGVPVPFPSPGPWDLVLDTEWARFGGSSRQDAVITLIPDRNTGKAVLSLPPYSARIFAMKPGAAAAPPPPDIREETGPARTNNLSLFTSMYLTGNFADPASKGLLMKLTGDFQWACRVEFTNAADVELKLSADDGSFYWGAADDWRLPVPYDGKVKRRGGPIKMEGVLNGAYLIRFNDDTLDFTITPAGAGKEWRTWTGATGSTVEARLVAVEGDQVILERRTGQWLKIAFQGLSPADRTYLRTVAP